MYANAKTIRVLSRINRGVSLPIRFVEYVRYQDILIISKELKDDDGLIFVLSKRTNPSYNESMEEVPFYIESYFKNMNYVLIYPYQKGVSHHSDIDNLTSEATIKAVTKIEGVIDNVIGAVTKRTEEE